LAPRLSCSYGEPLGWPPNLTDEKVLERLVPCLLVASIDAERSMSGRILPSGMSIEVVDMWVLIRTITYASLFIGFFLVFLPARVLAWSGVTPPPAIGVWQVLGMIVAGVGAAIAVSCILTFAFVGKGTPAPFDPPRQLVVRGPYRFVRNPMYVGAALALAGAALFYKSMPLLGYTVLFLVITYTFVLLHEEPTLRRTFGNDYEAYCGKVGRWWPRF
jgi:protein-S-isoprenylcysteine O-methyltransferase Ste14